MIRLLKKKRNDKSRKIKGENYKQNVTAVVNKMFVYFGNVGNRKDYGIITVTSFAKRY